MTFETDFKSISLWTVRSFLTGKVSSSFQYFFVRYIVSREPSTRRRMVTTGHSSSEFAALIEVGFVVATEPCACIRPGTLFQMRRSRWKFVGAQSRLCHCARSFARFPPRLNVSKVAVWCCPIRLKCLNLCVHHTDAFASAISAFGRGRSATISPAKSCLGRHIVWI